MLLMLHIAEVRRIDGRLSEDMSEMRSWLDHNHIQPDIFAYSQGSLGITYRVSFRTEDRATAFANAFEGALASADPQTPPRWVASLKPANRAAQTETLTKDQPPVGIAPEPMEDSDFHCVDCVCPISNSQCAIIERLQRRWMAAC